MICAITQQKGGVGKTTSAINLGAALRDLRKKVLLIDLDPQGSLTASLGINPDQLETTIYTALMEKGIDKAKDTIQRARITTETGLDLIPANIDLAKAEIELTGQVARERRLKARLTEWSDQFDYVLIDCPPSLGLLTVNALVAASRVIVPVQCHFLALRGLLTLADTITDVRTAIEESKGLKIQGILGTMHDRTNHANETMTFLRDKYHDLVYSAVIPKTIKCAQATTDGRPLLDIDPDSPASLAYRSLAQEVISRG
jgi:chromosome partitioning protein